MADVWLVEWDLPLAAEDAVSLSARLRRLPEDVEGAADAAAVLEAAVDGGAGHEVQFDVAEIAALRLALREEVGTTEGSPGLTALAERLALLDS